MSDFTEREKQFILGLEKLTRETGIAIGGCGCCGSPFLITLDAHELAFDAGYGELGGCTIGWISPADDFDWEEYQGNIVK